MVEYLKEENASLGSKLPARITLTAREKNRLIQLGTTLGSALKNLISTVSYRTFTRWVAGSECDKTKSPPKRKPGRPRTAEDIRELVVKIARENGWDIRECSAS